MTPSRGRGTHEAQTQAAISLSAAANRPARLALVTTAMMSGMALLAYVLLGSQSVLGSPVDNLLQQRTQILHTQVNIMGGGGLEGYPQGFGAYSMPVDMSIPPVKGARGRASFPFPSPASAPNAPAAPPPPPPPAIDTSKFVRRSEEDTRFRLLESRLHVDESEMERMRETIRSLKHRIDRGEK